MKKRVITVSFIALMLTLVGCSNHSSLKSDTKNSTPQVTAQQQHDMSNKLDFNRLYPDEQSRAYAKKMIGTKAPDFDVKNLKGDEIQLSKLKGQNVVLEMAQASCPHCIDSYPAVKSFKDMSKGKVKILTIFPNDKQEDVEKFFSLNQYAKDEEVVAGEGMNSIINDYQIEATPTFLFVDKNGYIQFVHEGGDVDEVALSSMSDLIFKTNLSASFNKTQDVKLQAPTDSVDTPKATVTTNK